MFKPDSPLINFLGKMTDLILLNLLAVILCIPVFTFGAVKTSMLYGIDKIMKDEEGSVFATFFLQIKEEFKRTTAIWLMYLFFAGVTLFDLRIMLRSELGGFSKALTAVFLALFVLETVVCFGSLGWSYKFNDNIRVTLKNALLISLLNLPKMLIVAALEVVPWLLLLFVDASIGMIVFFYGLIGISLTTVVEVLVFRNIHKPFLEKFDDNDDNGDSDDDEEE